MALYREGAGNGGFEAGLEMALRGILVSPKFLFRFEGQPDNLAPDTPYRISDLELASRLSFFLWSSIPDDELLDVAAKNTLHTPAVLEQFAKTVEGTDGKVLLHCASGGRAGHLYAAYLVKYQGKSPDEAMRAVEGFGVWPLPMERLLGEPLRLERVGQ